MILKNKVAFITGAGRGLGRAAAAALAREGASVSLLSRTGSELEGTADLVGSEGGKALLFPVDVTEESRIREAVSRTAQEFGGINILVNCAAEVGAVAPAHEVDPDDWKHTVNVNLNAIRQMCQETIPYMIRAGGGRIINVTSGMAEFVMPLFGAYSVSKAGLNHLTRTMAEEMRSQNIQINGLDPGVMDTRMQEEIRDLGPEVLGKALHDQFLFFKSAGQLKPPEEVAKLVVFLASDNSEGITGEIGGAAEYRDYGFGLAED